MGNFLFIKLALLVIIFHLSRSDGNFPPIANPVPYALSPTYLQYLAKQERKIYQAMKDYEGALEHRLKLVKRYTEDYETSSIAGTSDATEEDRDRIISSNPILSYRMLNRYAGDFIAIGHNIGENAEKKSSEIVYEAKGNYDFPSDTDTGDAVEALLRMQFMYAISSDQIASGEIPGATGQKIGLSTNQCYKIAKTAQNHQYYTLALDWFNTTMSRAATDPKKEELSFDPKTLEKDMLQIIKEHNKLYQEHFDMGHEYIYARRIRSLDSPRPLTLRAQLLEQYGGVLLINETNPDYYQALYANHISLCNGANFQTELEKSKLKCWQDTKRNPYWTINPLKIEMVNRRPQILQIYDIISDKWMSYLRTSAHGKLERAPGGENATPRTAAYAWFKDEAIPETPISRRIEFITGLNVVGSKASESLQIAAYAFGGHVSLHFDSKGPDDPKPDPKGDRVTTFLIYLNNVESGGLTSFPKLGFAVKPVKGSAVLWYTNKRNGNVDPWTLHGACPLIYGHKWIGTKWTHVNENILKRPCGLRPGE